MAGGAPLAIDWTGAEPQTRGNQVTFDEIAPRYDELWTNSAIGRLQREAVWRRVDLLFRPGDRVLDLGCGTGEDATHFMRSGIQVRAIDASREMVRIARDRGVDAMQLTIEELERLKRPFDGVFSNFGALNCVEKLEAIRGPLAKLVRPGGNLVICVMGRFCLWEAVWYLLHAQPRKAFRRWNKHGAASSLGVRVYYPLIRQIRRALLPNFILADWYGIGISVPPSYVTGVSSGILARLASFDRRAECLSPWRAMSDHRLLIFTRK